MVPPLPNKFINNLTSSVPSSGVLNTIFRVGTLLVVGVLVKCLYHVHVVNDSHVTTLELRTDESKDDDIGVHAAEEDTDDLSVVVPLNLTSRRQRELLTDLGLNGRTCTGSKVAELVSSSDDEGSEGAGRQLHEMDGNDTPSTLDTELLEDGSCHDSLGRGEGVRVEQCTANDASHNDRKTTTEDGRAVSHGCATSDCTKVSNDLSDGNSVGVESVLVLQHSGIEVLTSVRHEVETSHQQNHVAKEEPMALEGNLSLSNEGTSNAWAARLAHSLTFAVCLCLGKAHSEQNEQYRRAGTEPEKRAPSVGSGVDKSTSEDHSKQVSEGVTLLQHSTDETTGLLRTVLKCCRGDVSVKPTHGDTEECTDGKKLVVGLAETGAEFEDDEKNVVDNERPLASVTICCDTECDRAHRTEHQDECDAPCDILCVFAKVLGEVRYCQ